MKTYRRVIWLAVSALLASCRLASAQAGTPWTADPEGVGPVRAGMLLRDAQIRLGGSVALEDWPSEYGCNYARINAAPSGIAFMVWGDTIVRADVDTPGILTTQGVGVGSREADVLSRYAGHVRTKPHPYDGPEWHYVIVDVPEKPGFRMIFETDGKAVTSFRVGRADAVDLIEGCS